MKSKVIRAVSIILLLAVMTAVFCFSAQPAEESQQTSDGFLYKIISVFYPKIKTASPEQREEIMEKFSSPIRKFAHFSIFGLMGVLSLLSVISYNRSKPDIRYLIAWLICVLYSVSDEIHQHFVPGRSCEIRDMLIDSGGALLGVILASVFCFIIRKRAENSENREKR